ncbi:MAG: S1C family serine protease [Saprospiraceae bacterium]
MNLRSVRLVGLVAITALISTTFAFLLFINFAPPPIAIQQTPSNAQFTGQQINQRTNISPAALSLDFVTPSKRVTPAVVNIFAKTDMYRGSSGSGVIVSSDGYIITNHHVVDDGRSFTVTLSNNRELSANVVGTDPTTDLALLKVDARNLPTVSFGNSDQVQVGEWVLAVGNPFNLESTVTAGIVSAKGRSINIIEENYSIESFIQTDAVVNVGNSGGALVNTQGELVGINTAILTESGGYEGYSFAIPANLVKKVIDDIKDYGEVRRAILGVGIQDIDNQSAAQLGLDDVSGVMITRLTDGGSAAEAGLKTGDVIVSVNNRKTQSTAELQEQVGRFRPGDMVSVDYIRDGRKFRKERIRLQGIR